MRSMSKHVALQHFLQPMPALQKRDLKDQPGKGSPSADSAEVRGATSTFCVRS